MAQPARFRVSPAVLAPLGLEQLQDPALAVLELIKNAWDADSPDVAVEISEDTIKVSDTGSGMSRDTFVGSWLLIGASTKRGRTVTPKGRPLIGEKGLGRLASIALGRSISVASAAAGSPGFIATVDWDQLARAKSLDAYEIPLALIKRKNGTTITIQKLRRPWTEEQTEILVEHAQYLTVISDARFPISIKVLGRSIPITNPMETIAGVAEARIRVEIQDGGIPHVSSCAVLGKLFHGKLEFRDIPKKDRDPRLAGTELTLYFMRRTTDLKLSRPNLKVEAASKLLEDFQGVRVFREGINVPPYGLDGDDWAGLEKYRTQRGGPTMTPGNSQLVGEVRVSRSHSHLVITAGRSGFTDKRSVRKLAAYVRWTVQSLAIARRARELGLTSGDVPARTTSEASSSGPSPVSAVKQALRAVERIPQRDPAVDRLMESAGLLLARYQHSEDILRLYAQLASAGIAATNFAHELRTDFDVVSSALSDLESPGPRPDPELNELLSGAWSRIASFAALFRVLPIKTRRKLRKMKSSEVFASVREVSKLAPAEKIDVLIDVSISGEIGIVQAELDSIFVNLISNAVKAISENEDGKKGRILVEVKQRTPDSILISVADTGCGVPESIRDIMFLPLEGKFSEGTGMGLAIVSFIADRYNGSVSVRPAARRGYKTEFAVEIRSQRATREET